MLNRVYELCGDWGYAEDESAIWRPWKPIIRRKLINFTRIGMRLKKPNDVCVRARDREFSAPKSESIRIYSGSRAQYIDEHVGAHSMRSIRFVTISILHDLKRWLAFEAHIMINLIGFCFFPPPIFRDFCRFYPFWLPTAKTRSDGAWFIESLIITGLEPELSVCASVRTFSILSLSFCLSICAAVKVTQFSHDVTPKWRKTKEAQEKRSQNRAKKEFCTFSSNSRVYRLWQARSYTLTETRTSD